MTHVPGRFWKNVRPRSGRTDRQTDGHQGFGSGMPKKKKFFFFFISILKTIFNFLRLLFNIKTLRDELKLMKNQLIISIFP